MTKPDYSPLAGSISGGIPYSEAELIRRAIRNTKPPDERTMKRWVLVKLCFGTGSAVSEKIAREYGFDPFEDVRRQEGYP
jgi:hypothetical protein